LTAEQRLLLLDTWQRSGLPAGDFAPLVGISKHTLYAWKKRFDQQGPAGLLDQPRGGPTGSRLPELTRRTILMLKQSNPDWGCQRISDMLLRGPALAKAEQVVAKLEAMRLGKAAEVVRAGVAETLAYMFFPREHWTRIRTNNPLERLNREIRRRTRVVGAFPDGESALVLVAARLRHMAGSKWGTRRYLNMDKLRAVEAEAGPAEVA
jgi:transposase